MTGVDVTLSTVFLVHRYPFLEGKYNDANETTAMTQITVTTTVSSVVLLPVRRTVLHRAHWHPQPLCHVATFSQRRCAQVYALDEESEEERVSTPSPKRSADSTDAVASFLTRRFGYIYHLLSITLYLLGLLCTYSIGAGLAWLGILTIGSLGEQIKTRLEVRREEEGAKDTNNARTVTLPSGVEYRDRKIGGGSSPYKGALTAVRLKYLSSTLE